MTKQPNRILVYGMTDNPGGIETYLLNLLCKLNDEKVIFDFVTDFPDIAYKSQILEHGSKIYYIPAKGRKLFQHLKKFYDILKANPEYEKIYFNILDAGSALTMLIPWLLHRKVIVHSHNGSTDKKSLHTFFKPILNILCDKRIACSNLAATYMFGKKRGKRVWIVPNAIDESKFKFNINERKNVRADLGISEDTFVVCHIGRISKQKNPYGLLEIFKEVRKKNPKSLLLYVGTGELEEMVKKYAEQIGIIDKVIFLGKQKNVEKFLWAADVFLLPSFYEGLPIVGIEAQAASLPCVVSDSITSELNITGNVVFMSLDDSKEKWADEILEFNVKKRDIVNTKSIIDAGYSMKIPGKGYKKLLNYFEED